MVPEHERFSLGAQSHCFAGISLGNNHFTKKKFSAVAAWMSDNFTSCLILIPDSIYELSVQVSLGISPVDAHKLVMEMTQDFLDDNREILESDNGKFNVLQSSDLIESSEYQQYCQELTNLFQTDNKFNESINQFINTYFRRQQNIVKSPREHELSCEFILAELAIMACVIDLGYCVSAYPGSIGLFHEISAGEHRNIPKALTKLINVEIGFRTKNRKVAPLEVAV